MALPFRRSCGEVQRRNLQLQRQLATVACCSVLHQYAAMIGDFADRFRLALKALSLSRGGMASALGVDKSLVGRWANGIVSPSAHNLSRLTQFIAERYSGFNLADWDRSIPSFAGLLGVELHDESDDSQHSPSLLPPPFIRQCQQVVSHRGSAYEGFWRTTRPSIIMNGATFHDYGMIRINEDGLLLVRMGGSGLIFEGCALLAEGSLFVILYNSNGATPLFLIFRGVPLPKAELLDGLLLFSSLNAERTPAAVPILLERIGDLTGDVGADDARCAELLAKDSSETPDPIPELPENCLMRDIGPEAASRGGDLFLTASSRVGLSRGATLTGKLRG